MLNELVHTDYAIVLKLAEQILHGAVFKHNIMCEVDSEAIKLLATGVYNQTQSALSTLALQNPDLVQHIIRRVAPKSAAFISTIAYELIQEDQKLDYLVDAGTIMCLIQIIDHLMDRGDTAMLETLETYFENDNQMSMELRTRMQLVDHCILLSERVALQDTEIVIQAGLDVLRDEALILRSSKQYQQIDNTYRKDVYFRQNAFELADVSIRNGGLRPATYLVYLSYIHAGYNLPPIAEILESPEIMRLVRLGEWAIRLWDDWGDREIDAGRDVYTNVFAINLFLERNPYLTEAYLAVIADTAYYERAWNIIQEGNEGINFIIIGILREEFGKLKQTVDEKYCMFIIILERIIEAGFVNVAGDEAIAAADDVISDYGRRN